MNKAQSEFARLASRSLIGFGAVAMLVSAPAAFAQRAEDIIFTPEKVKTIPGHGMSHGEYPYDDDGFYRKEWVSTTARSKVKSSTTVNLPIPITSEEHSNYKAKMRLQKSEELKKEIGGDRGVREIDSFTEVPKREVREPEIQTIPVVASIMTDAEAIRGGFIGPYSRMNRRQAVQAAPAVLSLNDMGSTTLTSFSTFYHKVSSGDTLYAISRKYGVSVDALKKANGLTSDLIRVGQSLRLALAQHALGAPQM